jgi:predicted nucleotidyltransferase
MPNGPIIPNHTVFAMELAGISEKRLRKEQLSKQFAQETADLIKLVPDLDLSSIAAIANEYAELHEPEIDKLNLEKSRLQMMVNLKSMSLRLEQMIELQLNFEDKKQAEKNEILGNLKAVEVLDEAQKIELKSVYRSLARIFHGDASKLPDKFIKEINEMYENSELTKIKKIYTLMSELSEVDEAKIQVIFDLVEKESIEEGGTNVGISRQIIILENKLVRLAKLREVIMELRGQDLTIGREVLANYAQELIETLKQDILLLNQKLLKIQYPDVGSEITVSKTENQAESTEKQRIFEIPSTPEAMEEKLKELESFVLNLVNKGLMFSNSEERQESNSFTEYRGMLGENFVKVTKYESTSSNYNSLEITFNLIDEAKDTTTLGDYWKYDSRSFDRIDNIQNFRCSIEFNIHSSDCIRGYGTFYINGVRQSIYCNAGADFDKMKEIYQILLEKMEIVEELKEFNTPKTSLSSNESSALATIGKPNSELAAIENKIESAEKMTRKERMIIQAERIAEFLDTNSDLSEIILFGSLVEASNEYPGDIDMFVIGDVFDTRVTQLGKYQKGNVNNKFTNLLEKANIVTPCPDLSYTNGDFIPLSSYFFSDERYRSVVIQNQYDEKFFQKALSDCKIWDRNSKSFEAVSFDYFEGKYDLNFEELEVQELYLEDFNLYDWGDE